MQKNLQSGHGFYSEKSKLNLDGQRKVSLKTEKETSEHEPSEFFCIQ